MPSSKAESPRLFLMRHAKSSWKNAELADRDRPLKKRGRRDAARMGEFLASQGIVLREIISSPALRARETAEILAGACDAPSPRVDERLYEASVDVWRQVISELPRSGGMLLVGHNPEMESLLQEIAGRGLGLPTGTVVSLGIRPDSMFLTLEALTVRDVWRPKEI